MEPVSLIYSMTLAHGILFDCSPGISQGRFRKTQCQSVPHFSIREAQDLAKSTVHSPTSCARRLGAALWGRQRAAFLERVLDDWKVSTIFDCSPGSGALMEAALTRGVVYHGLCPMLSVFLALLVL